MSDRFQVATVSGWQIHLPASERGNFNAPEGLSATVCDTLYLWRELATYRSDDRSRTPDGRFASLGRDGALAAAQDHALYLNRLYGAA